MLRVLRSGQPGLDALPMLEQQRALHARVVAGRGRGRLLGGEKSRDKWLAK